MKEQSETSSFEICVEIRKEKLYYEHPPLFRLSYKMSKAENRCQMRVSAMLGMSIELES